LGLSACPDSHAPVFQPGRERGLKHRAVWVRLPPGALIDLESSDYRRVNCSRPSVGSRCETSVVYDRDTRRRALSFIEGGQSLRAISLSTGVSRSTLREWRDHPSERQAGKFCPRCAVAPELPNPADDSAYLLGLYPGDGCISVIGDPRKQVWVLRIACADAWPGLVEECMRAMSAARPGNKSALSSERAASSCWPPHGIGHACFHSMGPARSISERLRLSRGSNRLWIHSLVTLRAVSFTPMAAGSPIGCDGNSRTAIGGLSTRGTCSPTSRRTSGHCAGRRSTIWEWPGDCHGATRSRWLTVMP
jgi:hypothetical protein